MAEQARRPQRVQLRWYDGDAVGTDHFAGVGDAAVWRFDVSKDFLLTRLTGAAEGGREAIPGQGKRDWAGEAIFETEPAGDLATARGLAVVILTPKPEYDEEFNAWYDTEHVPRLAAAPGVLQAKRFVEPAEKSYLALYYLASPDVLDSPGFKAAAARTPWANRVVGGCLRAMEMIVTASLVAGPVTGTGMGE